ncbi:MAG: bifunctional proline dehydrogenase/L-glutamate gamma-semialdehyde dehydrogenase PutA [Devosiaceae bacterium]|nr:bifunctional proline dehydrogenase/L-glutamate gamma-semialdehyde dehydrogenase PutA [Devosiaceae bacterium]
MALANVGSIQQLGDEAMDALNRIREDIRAACLMDENENIQSAQQAVEIDYKVRKNSVNRAITSIENIRSNSTPSLMEAFLIEYGLSTDEGIALMCLAEALLRVPDSGTIDDLINDKIAPSSWSDHLGKSSSSLVNASTWALMLSGKILDKSEGVANVVKNLVKRFGEPVIRTAIKRAMKILGDQFVLGENIEQAIERGASKIKNGYTYSYDMLGEAALTKDDANEFIAAYSSAIKTLGKYSYSADIRENPGISIKLSALHPRYEVAQKKQVMVELVERTIGLSLQSKQVNIGMNIDAEESERLDLSLDVIEAVLSDERLAGWDGFGVVVQAYSKRAMYVIDWLYALAQKLDRKIMVRLVKGAYWDSEIKRAQVEGLSGYPVFTKKAATDVSFICCSKKLFSMTDRIYPQFATHNAHTVSAVLELANDKSAFEFQRLHGMGEALHEEIHKSEGTRCRIYAPVGIHRDLLAYLVRRLLENGANSSFVNQIVDSKIPVQIVAADPFEVLALNKNNKNPAICDPDDIYAPKRKNSHGRDLHNDRDLNEIETAREKFKNHQWNVEPVLAVPYQGEIPEQLTNPADPADIVGQVIQASAQDVVAAIEVSRSWNKHSATKRAAILVKASDLFEENFGEFFAVLSREAGKNPADAIAELREAVDFLRYYATQIKKFDGQEAWDGRKACGVFTCISPWNFPLAIFVGQISAALAAGNGVLAKPSELSPITAYIAVKLFHEAGVPKEVLQFLPGTGSIVGAKLTSEASIAGICFTGSTATAQTINKSMADNIVPYAPLIAETGGLNAMIVDSTALPEQAIKDIITSAFQSAGQRCSSLRILYLQEDIASSFKKMLFGAMDELVLGNPWEFSTDIGPVINVKAHEDIEEYIETARYEERVLKQIPAPRTGNFIGPTVIEVKGIADLEREIFGPVLHIATFKASKIDEIVDDINDSNYGLTFGLHTRIDNRIEQITTRLNVGNIYINRNQIGAVVGSQPFGGEGLSGTGPKAGGPHYLKRFTYGSFEKHPLKLKPPADIKMVQLAIDRLNTAPRRRLSAMDMPGPTGESNRLTLFPSDVVICLGPTLAAAQRQAMIVYDCGGIALSVVPGAQGPDAISGYLDRDALSTLNGIGAVALWSMQDDLRKARKALASRNGRIISLVTEHDMSDYCLLERHVCIDTTAAGGNASLLAADGPVVGKPDEQVVDEQAIGKAVSG